MEPGALDLLEQRLAATKADNRTTDLVLGACLGDDELDAAIAGQGVAVHSGTGASMVPATHAYLSAVEVEGFRGIGPAVRLDLPPGPGLTLVVGRNGSGKSSFAEAAELLLTGENKRWSGRPAIWQDGWRNLHHTTARIRTDLIVDGRPGVTSVVGTWPTQATVDGLAISVQVTGEARIDDVALQSDGPVRIYRPFLSYNELGSMLEDRPSDLYDALEAVLGLDDLATAAERLRQQRLAEEKVGKTIQQQIAGLVRTCAALDDARAQAAHRALVAKPKPELDALEAIVVGDDGADEAGIETLRLLANLRAPDWREAANAAIEIRTTVKELSAVAGTDAGRASELAELLDTALRYHGHHGDAACPVCGVGALDSAWRERSADLVASLRREAEAASRASAALQRAVESGRRLLLGPPSVLDRAAEVSVDPGDLTELWRSWASTPHVDPLDLADHLDAFEAISERVRSFAQEADEELNRREDVWKPVRLQLSAWLATARSGLDAERRVADLKRAEKWLKEASADLRDQRFAPIANAARSLWATLRQQSNIELGAIELEGAATRRRVSLEVAVDGVPASAIGVMSQGELHALALSLFLPRATSADSPFRFVVIDDPVQAMDPARVDGLARVLADTATTHQVIVFTHDDRLPESVRRQQIGAHVLEVHRQRDSRVSVRSALDPVRQLVDDAKALALTDELPRSAAQRVVPGFLRSAIEAACNDGIRRRSLAAGMSHAQVEDMILDADGLMRRVALLLHGDASKHTSVLADVSSRFGRSKADVLKRVNKGSHEGDDGDLWGLVLNAEALAQEFAAIS